MQFTRLIKAAVPYEERIGVVEALWRVAATDGINADEHGLMRLVANLLGVADQDSGLAAAAGAARRRLRREPRRRPTQKSRLIRRVMPRRRLYWSSRARAR